VSLFSGAAASDGFARVVAAVVCAALFFSCIVAFSYLESLRATRGEFYALALFSAAGMCLLAQATDLIVIFISLEVMSLAVYALCAYLRRGKRPAEAAFKYFILGSFASAIFLYGAALAFLTMLFGNLLAIPQRSVKRMLAYSAIAHAGYLLVAVASMASASPRPDATQGLLFYLASYAATVIGAFGVVAIIERRLALSGVGDDLSSWSGLSDRHPGLAAAMSLFMVSLAGIPPTAGFMAKLTVFRAAIEAGLAPVAV